MRPSRTREAARTIYAEVVEKATDQRPEDEDLAGMDAYGMAATIELEPALKQKLLDSRSEDERLDIVEELFQKAVERLERAEHVSEVARSNGKVRFVAAEQAVQAERQQLRPRQLARQAAVALAPAHRAGLDAHDVLAAARARRLEERALLRQVAEVTFELARVDQQLARDRLLRPVVARRAAVARDHDVDRAPARRALRDLDRHQVARLAAAAGREQAGDRRRSDAPHAQSTTTATPPRRGSPPPDRAPVSGLRATAWTPPK